MYDPEIPSNDARLVVTLRDVGADDLPLAGGKGANLGELLRAGFRVPDGFVITTAAYAALLQRTDLADRLAAILAAGDGNTGNTGLNDYTEDGSAIRAAFAATPMPAAVRAEIVAAYRRFAGRPVAVRSSATAEDLPGAAFAGQQDTYLDVLGEEALLEAVRNCWASLWTDRAMSYRKRQGIAPQDVAIAVVVQTMVPADAAGVLFTANPVTGRRDEIVIDAARGLGEAVVSGQVTPEHYVLAPDGRLRQWAPGEQQTPRSDAAGTTADGIPPSSWGRILTAAQLIELASIGRRAAGHFGRPQDMEWAVADGTVYVLQARPMTALPPEPPAVPDVHLNPFQKKLGPFFAEMFQIRPYPLDVDGWLKHVIIAMLHRMAGSVGVAFPSLSTLLPEEDGVVVALVPPVPHPTVRVLAAPVSVVRRVRRFRPQDWMRDPRFIDFREHAERLKNHDPQAMTWAQLLAEVRTIFAVTGAIADLRVSYLPASFLPQAPLRLILLFLGKLRLAPPLLAGAETRTEQANRGLETLATEVRETPALARAFDELEPAELLGRLSTDETFADFDRRFRAFLAEYGHRETVSVVLSSSPTWVDAPEVVLGLIKVLISSRGQASVDQTGDALRELLAHPALRNPQLRQVTLRAVEGSKIGTAFRDDSHFYLTLLLPALRRAYAEMGERLEGAGIVERSDDVFHLRFEELSGMADPAGLSTEEKQRIRDVMTTRAAKRAALAAVPLLDPEALFGVGGAGANGALLTGTGASRGSATGPVRIIREAAQFGTLRSGEILVCPYTNPAWTPLFQRAAAVIVDTGGMASHAAIVAREYGIPAVMGTGNGTRILTDGQRVTVDGTLGRVVDAQN